MRLAHAVLAVLGIGGIQQNTTSTSLSLHDVGAGFGISSLRDVPKSHPGRRSRTRQHGKRAVSTRSTTWNFVGCVNDGSSRALTNTFSASSANTVESCIASCLAQGYTIAGVEDGSQCLCGNILANGLGQTISSQCNVACTGNSAETCGGSYALDLYSSSYLGCFQDSGSRVLNGASYISGSLTPASCSSYCLAQGFAYAGVEYGTQCYCGNTISSSASSSCNMACGGDSSQICGGSYAMDLYLASAVASPTTTSTTTVATTTSSLGCFQDTVPRVLSGTGTIDGNMTPALCKTYCQGYAYAGVEYGTQCYCGNTMPTATSSSCNMACGGDSSSLCGGSYAMNVYAVPSVPTTTTTTAVQSTTTSPTGYIGCYQDTSPRSLNGPSTISGSMTPLVCAKTCSAAGYAYAGVEYSTQCYCGNSIASIPTLSASSCNMACGGDPSTICGGSYALSIYSTSAVVTSSTHLGCYVDGNQRTLPDSNIISGSMTVALCVAHCQQGGYAYAGLEYSTQCWCGNSLTASTLSSSSCNMACGADSSTTCGGSYALDVYSVPSTTTTTTTTTTTSTTTSSTTAPTASGFVGCYVDGTSRTLSGSSFISGSMTPAVCMAYCAQQNYIYAGVEYSTQCYCGNSLGSTQTSNSCNMACGGASSLTCGGSYALDVYLAGTATTSTTTTATTTSTTTSTTTTATATSYTSAFPALNANAAINDAAYIRLTTLLPQALRNAISISSHSWELGTLANSLTEVFYPGLSPYSNTGSSTPPWAVLDVITGALSSYSWSGSPSTVSASDNTLKDYLTTSSSPVGLQSTPLADGDGALGDPCSLGAAAWIAAEYFQQTIVSSHYNNGRKGIDYAWAVGNQYTHLEAGTRDSTGALSQREGYYELWSDMGYMIPPFLGYIGMASGSQSMLNDAISQWALECNELINYNTMLFNHIPDWDNNPWATGNGWMLAGFTRVVASINAAGQSGTFSQTINTYESTVAGVFNALFNQLNSQNLVPNYMLGSGDSTGDAAGTALITAAYYRFRVLASGKTNSGMDAKAAAMFDAVVGKLGSDGWLTQVVNPEYNWQVFSGQSPEAQSFLGLMWAARTAAGI